MKQAVYDIPTPYTASYIIFRKEGKIAFLLRQNTSYMSGFYGLVAGKVEIGESFTQAAVREAKEEAGVDVALADMKPILMAHRRSEDSLWVDLIFEATNWTGDVHNAEPAVHSEIAWFEPNNLPENTVPYVKNYIEAIVAGKTYAEYGWDKKT